MFNSDTEIRGRGDWLPDDNLESVNYLSETSLHPVKHLILPPHLGVYTDSFANKRT